MTCIPKQPEDKNSIIKGQGCIIIRQMDKQVGVIGIQMEFDVGLPTIGAEDQGQSSHNY